MNTENFQLHNGNEWELRDLWDLKIKFIID